MPDVLSSSPGPVPATPAPGADRPAKANPTQARRNRRWMLLMAMTPVVFAILYALGVFTDGNPEPVVHPVYTPAGYSTVTDAYFGFALPATWKQNSAYSDSNGDFYYNGPGGWLGESEIILKTSPSATTPVPESLQSYGANRPTPYREVGGHRVKVPGTAFAWAVTLTRPGGFRAQAVDVWEPRSQTELWLMVHASPTVDRQVVGSLRGSATN